MANLRIRPFTKEKESISIVGRVKPNGRCKKHPKHQQSPGVCSLCLREKLTHQSTASISRSRTKATSSGRSSSVSSLSDSSSSASSCASPTRKSGALLPAPFLLTGEHGIVRSKSMAVFPRRRDGEEGGVQHGRHDHKSANKSGFWYKLLHPRRKIIKDERDSFCVYYRDGGRS